MSTPRGGARAAARMTLAAAPGAGRGFGRVPVAASGGRALRRAALALAFGTSLLAAACAPIARYQPSVPPPALPLIAGDAEHALGTLAVENAGDSTVVLIVGDNRPGLRMQTRWIGWPWVRDAQVSKPLTWPLALVGLPLWAAQAIVPTLDGVQDLATALFTHRPNGGGEAQVLRELEGQLPVALVINTGDLVYDGRRAKLWDDFTRKHASLRAKAPFAAAPGNHERLYSDEGRAGWDGAMGAPPRPGRYWYSLDLPDGVARLVFLDSNLIADPKDRILDDEQGALASEQFAWLETAFEGAAGHRFVVLHHPLFSSGNHVNTWTAGAGAAAYRQRLLAICAAANVTAIFAGHEHLYYRLRMDRADGTALWHVTTGGGGSPLYPVRDDVRAAQIAAPLPEGLRADPASALSRTEYHLLRLVLPGSGAGPARLDAYRVGATGGTRLMDRITLDAPRTAHEGGAR